MTRKYKIVFLILITIIIAVPFIYIYAGHFLYAGGYKEPVSGEKERTGTVEKTSTITYRHVSTKIDGQKQEIDILEVDLKNGDVVIKPVLSFDSVFGFEKLSSMAERTKAYAAINAGFFHQYGQPSGMVMIDGKLISASEGNFPVFVLSGKIAYLKELSIKIYLKDGNNKIKIDKINTLEQKGKAVIYTREFGTDNRAKAENITYIIEKGIVRDILTTFGQTDIPQEGMLVTVYKASEGKEAGLPLNLGDRVELVTEPLADEGAQCYQCGSWLVKDGRIVVPERDPWVGVMTNYDPRTAIGVKKDGTVILVTVDGRQPDYSIGFTGKQLAEYLKENGAINAAMLDGGASTQMIVEGKTVNRPSFRGQERLLGGAITVKMK